MDLNCTLLCASGAAYDIDPVTGVYTPDILFSKNVAFESPGPIVINNSGTDRINACLVGKNSTGIIVAFRGTLPPGTPDSFGDWVEDLFAEPGPCDSFPGKVHSGFCQDINTIFPAVFDAVRSLDPASNPVYVTGHSKGGALASLGAYLLTRAGISVKQVVTFASPKTGDKAFQVGYQRVIANQIRYENYGDLVPLVPPADEFITILADAVSLIPDIGPRLAAIIREAANWDYEPVGAEWFIESAANDFKVILDQTAIDQVGDFVLNLGEHILDPLTALGNAHSLHCGFGYMSGTCPSTICTST